MRDYLTKAYLACCAIMASLLVVGCQPAGEINMVAESADDFPVLSGEYLGQEPPGMEGKLFAPGVMSTGLGELNAVFFPGGKEVLFSVHVSDMRWALVMCREENGRWTEPEVAPFSGEYGGVDPAASVDGNRVFFCSNRPLPGASEAREDYDIWYVDRTEDGWSEPVNMGAPINSETHEFYPSLTADGTLYFQSRREGGIGLADIYRAELVDGGYLSVELLPAPINSEGFEGDTFAAPDDSYLIVSTVREESFGAGDLYITFRTDDGGWTPLKNMGPEVNTFTGENCPILSPCGKYLFYTSRMPSAELLEGGLTYKAIKAALNKPMNGFSDIYWISAEIIERLRP